MYKRCHERTCLWISVGGQTLSFYAPNFEKVGDILVSACPYVCVCLCVFMFEISS